MTNLQSETLAPIAHDHAIPHGSRDELLDDTGRMEALLPVESDPTLAAPRLERTDPASIARS